MRLTLFALIMVIGVSPGLAQERRPDKPTVPQRTVAKFPLQVSKNRRYLTDQRGHPFLVIGDSAWSLIAQLREPDIKAYLENRQRRGFNSLLVNLLEHKFASAAPRTRAGLEPFTRPGDFSTPNARYFDFAHQIIGWAQERGQSVWLCPAYLGANNTDEGFFKEIGTGGVDRLKAYGKFVGARFKDLPNIIWVLGGDRSLPKQHFWMITALADAIREGGAKQLMTIHGGGQSAIDVVGDRPWIDINTTYSYTPDIFRLYRRDYGRQKVRPFVLIESTYENEHNSRPEQICRQAYWAMTCGACGQFFGNNPIWHFDGPGLFKAPHGWRAELDSIGSRDMTRLRTAFADRPWYNLVPDLKNALVTKGVGEGTNTITAAMTADGKLAMIYIPTTGRQPRSLSVDMSRFTGPVAATWFNPTNGPCRPAASHPLANKGVAAFRSPGDNGTGTNDWLLIIEVVQPVHQQRL